MRSVSWRRLPASRSGRGFVVTAVVCAAAALVGLAARFVDAGRPWTLGIVAFSPYLMLGAFVAFVLMLLARYRPGAVVVVILLVLCALTEAGLYRGATPPAGARALAVMTSNLHLGTADARGVVALVRRHHVEVLMLEELTGGEQRRLAAAGLDRVLPFHVSAPRTAAAGTGLWSRYPLTGERQLGGFTFAFVTARVHVPGLRGVPTLAALHLAGPVPDSADWLADVRRLPRVLAALPAGAPVVVGGDFNATPDTVQFRALLTGGYRDAAQQAGGGVTRTYPADRWFPPLIAIDHVLTHGATACATSTLQVPGSDHRALLVSVAVPGAVARRDAIDGTGR